MEECIPKGLANMSTKRAHVVPRVRPTTCKVTQTNERSDGSETILIEVVHLKRGIDPIMYNLKALKLGKEGKVVRAIGSTKVQRKTL